MEVSVRTNTESAGPGDSRIENEEAEIQIVLVRRDIINRSPRDISEIDAAFLIDRHAVADRLWGDSGNLAAEDVGRDIGAKKQFC